MVFKFQDLFCHKFHQNKKLKDHELSPHFLISNVILQQKELGLLGEVTDSTAGAGNRRDEPGAPCSASQ